MTNANINNQELLEKIEYLRENADVGYEEALTLLERYDGDMTRVLVELERGNRIRRPKGKHPEFKHGDYYREEFYAKHAEHRRRHGETMNKLVNILFHKSIIISKNDKTIVNLPVVFYIAMLFAPHLLFPSLALIFITGCRIHGESSVPKDARSTVNNIVNNAAQNVRTTFDSVTSTIKNDFMANDAKPEGADEGGDFTVE
ncbi:MAG: hypothetical protein LBD16_04220 [Oscillospiraceae bacterium]|jgi:hypothetical protein|nr:hypothetical protein [Oscillospiraceae bacterium]